MDKRDMLKEIGFVETPYDTVMDSLDYDLGRGRRLSFQGISTPNEILFLLQLDAMFKGRVSNLIVLRNYDYDGFTEVKEIEEIIKAIIKPVVVKKTNLKEVKNG